MLRDMFRSRAIYLIDFPLTKCSRRIRPIVSTISIPHRPLQTKAGSTQATIQGVKFWTPIPRLTGQELHAETQDAPMTAAPKGLARPRSRHSRRRLGDAEW